MIEASKEIKVNEEIVVLRGSKEKGYENQIIVKYQLTSDFFLGREYTREYRTKRRKRTSRFYNQDKIDIMQTMYYSSLFKDFQELSSIVIKIQLVVRVLIRKARKGKTDKFFLSMTL